MLVLFVWSHVFDFLRHRLEQRLATASGTRYGPETCMKNEMQLQILLNYIHI